MSFNDIYLSTDNFIVGILASFKCENRKTPNKNLYPSFDHRDFAFFTHLDTQTWENLMSSNSILYISCSELTASSRSDKGLSAGDKRYHLFMLLFLSTSAIKSATSTHIFLDFTLYVREKLRKRRTFLRFLLGKVAARPPADSLLCLLSHAAF